MTLEHIEFSCHDLIHARSQTAQTRWTIPKSGVLGLGLFNFQIKHTPISTLSSHCVYIYINCATNIRLSINLSNFKTLSVIITFVRLATTILSVVRADHIARRCAKFGTHLFSTTLEKITIITLNINLWSRQRARSLGRVSWPAVSKQVLGHFQQRQHSSNSGKLWDNVAMEPDITSTNVEYKPPPLKSDQLNYLIWR